MNSSTFYPGAVVFEIQSTNKSEAIREIISRTNVFDDIPSKTALEEAIFDREKQDCTGFGHGVAFAHGKLPGITRRKIALGISRQGINYNSFDKKPVNFLFVLATNPDMCDDYLKHLSILARMVRTEGFQDEILSCFKKEDVLDKLIKFYSLSEKKEC
jgi:mannitol/fructose-specific phosphotransferase system IIA component (Ntr-type)